MKIIFVLICFSGAGAFGTLAHFCLMFVLVYGLNADALVASMAGAVLGATVNYLLSYFYVFRSKKSHLLALPRFLLIAGQGMALNFLLMAILVRHLGLNYLLSQIVATALILLLNFIGNYLWTFKSG